MCRRFSGEGSKRVIGREGGRKLILVKWREWEGGRRRWRRRGKILSLKVSCGREVGGCVGGRMDEVEKGKKFGKNPAKRSQVALEKTSSFQIMAYEEKSVSLPPPQTKTQSGAVVKF